jgi:hypothetical protein
VILSKTDLILARLEFQRDSRPREAKPRRNRISVLEAGRPKRRIVFDASYPEDLDQHDYEPLRK